MSEITIYNEPDSLTDRSIVANESLNSAFVIFILRYVIVIHYAIGKVARKAPYVKHVSTLLVLRIFNTVIVMRNRKDYRLLFTAILASANLIALRGAGSINRFYG